MTYTVRTIADGEHYFEPETFDSEILASAYFDSTVSRVNREDGMGLEITVDLINDDTDDVLYSHTIPAYI